MKIRYRDATTADAPFIADMFVIAADWNPSNVKGAAHWRADSSFAQYLGGWKRETDFGVIAEIDSVPVGAAWWRFFSADDPGYGFIDDETPELGIGVLPAHRGSGIGRALLRALIAARSGRLSLSVEGGNPAVGLYRSEGFLPVGRVGEATTMLRTA